MHQVILEASLTHSNMEDEVEILNRTEQAAEKSCVRQLASQSAHYAEERKTMKGRIDYFLSVETAYGNLLQQVTEDEASRRGGRPDDDISFQLIGDAVMKGNELVESMRENRAEEVKREQIRRETETLQMNEEMRSKDDAMKIERESHERFRSIAAKEKAALETELRQVEGLVQEAEHRGENNNLFKMTSDYDELIQETRSRCDEQLEDVRSRCDEIVHGRDI